MALNRPRTYLVCYDITDPKRLLRVHRFLRREGLPVQYSVFTAALNAKALGRLVQGLQRLIDPRSDDVRIYPIAACRDQTSLGLQFFPDDVMLMDGGIDLLSLQRDAPVRAD